MKKINLNDLVVFSYVDYNNNAVSVSATVKELIDDWYGECELLGANDRHICETYIAGEEFTNGFSDVTIEDLMESLVKETGYSEPKIDEKAEDLLKYYDAGLVAGLNKDGSNKMSFETKGEVDTIDMLAAIVEGYAAENSLSMQHVLAEIETKLKK